jgi:hypothetical protein
MMPIKNCRKFVYRERSDNDEEVRWILDVQLIAAISEMVCIARANYYSFNTSVNALNIVKAPIGIP